MKVIGWVVALGVYNLKILYSKLVLTMRRMSSDEADPPLTVLMFPYLMIGSLFFVAQNGVLNLRNILTEPKNSTSSIAFLFMNGSGGLNDISETARADVDSMA